MKPQSVTSATQRQDKVAQSRVAKVRIAQKKLIQSFVDQYQREYDFYHELARMVYLRCDAITSENGIRCIVSFRAKSPKRLGEKLKQRSSKSRYRSEEHIRTDIIDLSGIRIALYFPGDKAKVAKLISENFVVVREKSFPEKQKKHSGLRFNGYHAEHYLVRLDSASLPETQQRYGESTAEIQVASVLMHAWSEVEHDLVYKPLSGQVSLEERTILDGINGIVLSGEIFLERLQAAFEARVSLSGSTFSNQYELAAFLYDHLRSSLAVTGSQEPVMGRVDILFRLAQIGELNSSDSLAPYLASLDAETEQQPLADQVLDRILELKPELSGRYFELRRAATGRGRSSFGGNYPAPDIVGSFMQKWTLLERFTRAWARTQGIFPRRNMMPPVSLVIKQLELPEHLIRQVETLRRLRNNLVHGGSIPEENLISAADKEIDELLDEIENGGSPAVRDAMNWAKSGAPDPQPSPRDDAHISANKGKSQDFGISLHTDSSSKMP